MDSNVPPIDQPSGSAVPQPPPLPSPPPRLAAAPRKKSGGGWKVATVILACLLMIALVFNPLHILQVILFRGAGGGSRTAGPKLEEVMLEDNESANKIAVVPVEGVISSDFIDRTSYGMVEYIKDQLKMAGEDDRVKGVVLKVNSPGGEV